MNAASHLAHPSPLLRACRNGLALAALAITVVMAGCGGGGGDKESGSTPARSSALSVPQNDAEAHRFLVQATFGPTPSDIQRVKALGYSAWIDEQLARPAGGSYYAVVKREMARRNASDPYWLDFNHAWWTFAVQDSAQLRHRVAFALSQIFVVSNLSVDTRLVATYMDTLTQRGTGSYRELLEAVALHPAMGTYLSHLYNRKEDLQTGRVPDENFAREVMQLFSIGLHELDDSGQPKLVNGRPVETYTASDVSGMAKVFTGLGWYRAPDQMGIAWWRCFWRAPECAREEQYWRSMSFYDNEHSVSEKRFLGVVIPAQPTANPAESLRIALDRLASHPNTAPFISRQLIQRLVSSNPSPAYVADITRVFRSSNGNIGAVVKAILLHAEARQPEQRNVDQTAYGKLREPVLRLTHVLRAMPHQSVNLSATSGNQQMGYYLSGDTENAATGLGQAPLRSPSVFNFFRPGYTPPQSLTASKGLVAPEMQITSETSALGYANFMASALQNGWGQWHSSLNRLDVQFQFNEFLPQAGQRDALVNTLANRLLGQPLPAERHDQAVAALGTIGQDGSLTEAQRLSRVRSAVLLITLSPEYLIQR
ncbi:DUF1800 family protein [Aquabacterium fontiphilum]|uniref:DUF1800 domain-containing protein n=1 Tax=Aquabacterium fontiphilum TaxID=450365 RepID=UPI00137692EE|nr:DUF1800 domain-containing protein [Aquabacterium fontiphilum]NBD20441.1 DUF1800 family protein [Aquabacterium fontiphilum]